MCRSKFRQAIGSQSYARQRPSAGGQGRIDLRLHSASESRTLVESEEAVWAAPAKSIFSLPKRPLTEKPEGEDRQ